MEEADVLVVGCGLTGSVIARCLAEEGKNVHILEDHIGGNLYDYRDHNGLLLQKYGPHAFFTDDVRIKSYVERFVPVKEYYVDYRTSINGKMFPMPFNFRAIDMLYPPEKADKLKAELLEAFPGRETVSVAEIVAQGGIISEYGKFMYENEYRLYTSKQWGQPIENVSPSVFGRVPVYLSYKENYQAQKYQFVPAGGFTDMFRKMLDHPGITYTVGVDTLEHLKADEEQGAVTWMGKEIHIPVIYTGTLDELFGYKYGQLPYRSLEFVWKEFPLESVQEAAVVAWPQAEKVTRVTEYTKLPPQRSAGQKKTVIAVEIPFEYDRNRPFGNEPYYPIVNEEAQELYGRYRHDADMIGNLFPAGRLADYKYYNMDHAIQRAWDVAELVLQKYPCQ